MSAAILFITIVVNPPIQACKISVLEIADLEEWQLWSMELEVDGIIFAVKVLI